MGFTFWTFRPIDHNHPHGENSVATITFPEKYVLKLNLTFVYGYFIYVQCTYPHLQGRRNVKNLGGNKPL